MTTYWIDSGQPKLTYKIQDLSYEAVIISQEAKKKKYIKTLLSINLMLKNEIKKNSQVNSGYFSKPRS